MGELPRMTEKQFRRARKLIRRLCANYDGGNCLPLDDGDVCPCPQLIAPTLICKYFRAAVLPADRELCAEVLQSDTARRCADCGTVFVPTGSRGVYCPACSLCRERRRKAEWARKHRERSRRLGPKKP